MATLESWVHATRRHLMSGRQEMRNTLSVPYTAGDGTLSFNGDVAGIAPGTTLTVGLNSFYVQSVNGPGKSAVVIGGQDGTEDVDAGDGELVRVNPRFTDFDIVEALQAEIASLSAPGNGLYRIAVIPLTGDLNVVGYDFPAPDGFLDVHQVQYANPSAESLKDWSVLDKNDYRLDRDADSDMFESGFSLQILQPFVAQGNSIRVLCRAGFTPLTGMNDDQADTGLPATAFDIPPLGAAMRLIVPREIKRNFTEGQSDTRRAGEVPPGAVANSFRPLAALRQQRIAEEAARLVSQRADRRW